MTYIYVLIMQFQTGGPECGTFNLSFGAYKNEASCLVELKKHQSADRLKKIFCNKFALE